MEVVIVTVMVMLEPRLKSQMSNGITLECVKVLLSWIYTHDFHVPN